ncbi:PUA-like domain-containing protein [Lentinula aciculospora]|uniref:PUA-like domain-containing protein n=1 Tax=Lentinula aciculospora TaxID=153920 RepID=A0A9W9AG23_9AGAR|nr:PUA-like domain-containing protein [Lentinula aciculospora]
MSERLRAQLLKNSDFFPDPLGNNVIEGLAVGTIFSSRQELSNKNVHRPTYAGISGTKELGAESVVLSGQYEDDGDQGNVIIYTGTGGQKNSFNGTGPQVKDQSFDHRMNQQLYKSYQNKRPIRVIRGSNLDSQYAPAEGYRYDGMYRVTDAYMDEGYRGYAICKFKLERLPGQPPIPIAR